MIPADSVIICNREVSSSESALTGEPEDLKKSKNKDCFLLSSCLITEGEGCRAVVIGIGAKSQWGKIKANLVIERSARLDATSATIAWLQLDSPPVAPVTVTARRGGHLFIDHIKVTSWDSTINDLDTTIANGRSYLLALEGGRMDILNSDISYLGASSGEPSGLSWRKRLKVDDPTTGATGTIGGSGAGAVSFASNSAA